MSNQRIDSHMTAAIELAKSGADNGVEVVAAIESIGGQQDMYQFIVSLSEMVRLAPEAVENLNLEAYISAVANCFLEQDRRGKSAGSIALQDMAHGLWAALHIE